MSSVNWAGKGRFWAGFLSKRIRMRRNVDKSKVIRLNLDKKDEFLSKKRACFGLLKKF